MNQDLRSFVGAVEEQFPGEVVRVSQPVDLKYDIMALVLEYERRQRFPILIFDHIRGHTMPVVCNVMAGRRQQAWALGVQERELPRAYSQRIKNLIEPQILEDPPFRQALLTGDEADLGLLPVPTFFAGDAGPYLTAGMFVARHPDTGVVTHGFHRCLIKGRQKIGTSFHSRRRMFEYQRAYEERGQNMPAAICLGLHPVIAMGAGYYPPPKIDKFQVCGGLFGEPMQVARCSTMDLLVPAWSEIVIEGEVLAGEREPEGPFGEFTGYFSGRSTQNVFQVKAISMRQDAWFQCIASGRTADHISTLALLRGIQVRLALEAAIPGFKEVCFPPSGCASFSAYISIRQTRPGEAKHALSIALGAEPYLKLAVVVDDDVDVFDESDVMWAIATRVQADRDLMVINKSMGAILDPSATEEGLTAKMGIDATKPFGEPYPEKLATDSEVAARARALVDSLESGDVADRALHEATTSG